MLPELDGRAVIRAVRRDDEAGATPILILSRPRLDARSDRRPRGRRRRLPAEAVLAGRARPAREVDPAPDGRAPADAAGTDRRHAAPTGPDHRHADLVIDLDRYEVTRDGEPIPLTRVEFRLLQTLARGRRPRPHPRPAARRGLRPATRPRSSTGPIDVHIGRLRDKLGDDADAPRYVATVRGVGYRAARA